MAALARVAREVYLQGPGDDETRARGAAVIQKALPLDISHGLTVLKLTACAEGYRIGKLFVARAPHPLLAPGVAEQQ